jgi:hypothetical protein
MVGVIVGIPVVLGFVYYITRVICDAYHDSKLKYDYSKFGLLKRFTRKDDLHEEPRKEKS